MKVLTLNIWGGKKYQELIPFIEKQSQYIDVFCFQEVFSSPKDILTPEGMKANILEEIIQVLPEFDCYFDSQLDGYEFGKKLDFPLAYGLATFIRKNIPVKKFTNDFISYSKEEGPVHRVGDFYESPKNIQIFQLDKFSIANYHGYAFPTSKLDTEERIRDSKKIKKLLSQEVGNIIVVGDFNMHPQTESISILADGLRNLIKDNDIKTTRPDLGKEPEVSDYIFVDTNVDVLQFEVLPDVVSDHLALVVEFK